MPEGDTIHHMATRIGAVLEGRVPEQILTPHPRHSFDRWPERLKGRTVRSVDAHGKHLFVRFEGELTLHSHLRMTGLWGVYRAGTRWSRARSRAWLVMRHEGSEVVEFDGPRLELRSESALRHDPHLSSLGQDVLKDDFDVARFLTRLRAEDPARPIGDALLEQRTVAGIGNVWKSELCFAQGLDPWKALRDVSDEQAVGVLELARALMAISAREGMGARPRAVYKRAGRPCERCGTIIRVRGQWENGRLTFWCPGCQS